LGQQAGVIRFCAGQARMHRAVREAALASFSRHGVYSTKERTGVLVFISLLEKRVEILADQGIHEKVGEEYWRSLVRKLVAGIRAGKALDTLVEVIGQIGHGLATHFPHRKGSRNELSDELQSS
jgi:putative membrane protein